LIQTFLLLKIIIPFVTLYNKIPYQIILLVTISFSISFCTYQGKKTISEDTIHLYKTQLDSLIQNINKLQADNEPDQELFFADYLEAIQIIDLLPDSTD